MDRNDFEHLVAAKLEDIRAAYKKYNPKASEDSDGIYLSICIRSDAMSCTNKYWDVESVDRHFPVNLYVQGDKFTSFPS